MHPALMPCTDCAPPPQSLDVRLLLLGDGGEDLSAPPALALLRRTAAEAPARTVAVFLGDNVYPAGVPSEEEVQGARRNGAGEDRRRAERVLRRQVQAARGAGARAIFVPGNHDWNRSRRGGLARVLAQQRWFDGLADARVEWLPRDGCPGPALRDLGGTVRLLVLDSEWFFAGGDRRRTEVGCRWGDGRTGAAFADPVTAEQVYGAVARLAAAAGGRRVVLALHHPLRSYGSHAGRFSPRSWLFPLTHVAPWAWVPLPLLYPALRTGFVRPEQDLGSSAYATLRRGLQQALETVARRPAVVAAGHEHAIQIIGAPDGALLHVVSGAASKASAVGRGQDTLFKRGGPGIIALDVDRGGRAVLRVLEPGADGRPQETFLLRLAG